MNPVPPPLTGLEEKKVEGRDCGNLPLGWYRCPSCSTTYPHDKSMDHWRKNCYTDSVEELIEAIRQVLMRREGGYE